MRQIVTMIKMDGEYEKMDNEALRNFTKLYQARDRARWRSADFNVNGKLA